MQEIWRVVIVPGNGLCLLVLCVALWWHTRLYAMQEIWRVFIVPTHGFMPTCFTCRPWWHMRRCTIRDVWRIRTRLGSRRYAYRFWASLWSRYMWLTKKRQMCWIASMIRTNEISWWPHEHGKWFPPVDATCKHSLENERCCYISVCTGYNCSFAIGGSFYRVMLISEMSLMQTKTESSVPWWNLLTWFADEAGLS
jgi:hypothetical protein